MDSLQRLLDEGCLRVGTTMDTPGFSMRRAQGGLYGFDIELVSLLAAVLAIRIDFIKITGATLIKDLNQGKFDIVASGLARSLGRAREATYSRPYLSFGRQLLIRADDSARFSVLADLDAPDVRVGANSGGPNQSFAEKHFARAKRVFYAGNTAAHEALLNGEIDAQVTESTVARYLSRIHSSVKPFGPLNDVTYVAILLRRDARTLRDFINIWLDQIELDGTLGDLRARWLGETEII